VLNGAGTVTATVLFGLIATTSAGSVAITAVLAAFTAAVFVPSLILLVCEPNVVWFAAVAAPDGRGREAAETGTVLLGLIATTRAGSVAIAAVLAAFTAAVFVPSVIFSKTARATASPVG
jgi:hypothetical protein